jgi:hypothetical protein
MTDGLPQLIGFCGWATAGKDTAADTLVEWNDYKKTYMSKNLEQALLKLDPIVSVSSVDSTFVRYAEYHAAIGYDATKDNPEVRRLLQTLGTEVGREMFGENVWIDMTMDEIASWLMAGDSVAVTGIRFRNELDCIRAAGGTLVWVDRPGVEPVNTHVSDNSIGPEDCDVRILNDSTVENLHVEVIKAVFKAPTTPAQRMAKQECGFYRQIQRDLSEDPVWVCGEHGWPSKYAVNELSNHPCKAVEP